MEFSFFAPVLCLLLLTSAALAPNPDMDSDELTETEIIQHASEDHLGRNRPITRIYHPTTNSCVSRKLVSDPLNLGPCTNSDPWSYTPQKNLMIKGAYFCLQAIGEGKPVRLSIICTPEDTQWERVGDSERTHLSTKLADGTAVCLDVKQDGTIVSNSCGKQASAEGYEYDSQWFDMVTGPRSAVAAAEENGASCAAVEAI